MGLCLENKKRDMKLGYIGFGFLRQCIAYAYDNRLGELYKKMYVNENLTQDEYEELENLSNNDLGILLWHSDCDGKLTSKECKKIYNVIKNIDISTQPLSTKVNDDFEQLKEMLKDGLTIHFY